MTRPPFSSLEQRGDFFVKVTDRPAGNGNTFPVLEGGCLLKFVAVGRIVRVEDARASITIEQYEFRTRRSKDTAAAGPDKPARSAVQYS